MEEQEFNQLDSLADDVDEACDKWLDSPEISLFKQAMERVAKTLPAGHSLELAVELRVFDPEREKSVRMLTIGLACQPGEDAYRVTGDSSPQRYLCEGNLCELPHDYCPRCWGAWDFKWDNSVCPECGIELGDGVKVLLDRDLCPHCGQGKLSMSSPICNG